MNPPARAAPWSAVTAIGFGWRALSKSPSGVGLATACTLLAAGLPGILLGFAQAFLLDARDRSVDLVLLGAGTCITLALQAFVMGGVIDTALRTARGETLSFWRVQSNVLACGVEHFDAFLASSLLFSLGVGVAGLFGVVPGIVLALGFLFCGQVIVDRRANSFDALRKSWELTRGHKLQLFGFALLSVPVILLGYAACGIGVLIGSFPVLMVASSHIYLTLSGEAPRLPSGAVEGYGAPRASAALGDRHEPRSASVLEPAPAKNLGIGFAVALLVHAVPVVAWVWVNRREPPPVPEKHQLVVDLFGLISDRQMEERLRATEEEEVATPSAAPAPEPERPERSRTTPQEARPAAQPVSPRLTQNTPSPVEQAREAPTAGSAAQRAEAPSENEPSPSGPGAGAGVSGGSPKLGGDDIDQVGRTVQTGASEGSKLAKYGAVLQKRISAHMIYPADARLAGQAGSPTIRFAVTQGGGILPGSLLVARSSGHPNIDRAAIRAALDSVPFPPPPRDPTSVTVTLSFSRE